MKLISPKETGAGALTRSSSASYINSSKYVASATTNEARFSFNPTTGDPEGLLIENASTNLVLQSADFSNASWSKTNVTVTANSQTSPDNTLAGDTLNATSANGYVSQSVSFTGNAVKSISVWIKAGTATASRIKVVDDATAADRLDASIAWASGVPTVTASIGTFVDAVSYLNGWYRVRLKTIATTAAANTIRIYPANSGTGTIYAWGAQAENGIRATSYIATTTATVTRAADVIGTAGLVYSNVLENDATNWTAGTYTLGQKVIYNHDVYEVIVSSTTDQPDVGAAKTSPTWLNLGATNRYKMFDNIISTQTTNSGSVRVGVVPNQVANSVAFFGLEGTEITVSVNDPAEGLVYTETRSLLDTSVVLDWWSYFFEPISYLSDAVFLSLPSYSSASIAAYIDAGAATAKCGEMVLGVQRTLGVTNFDTSVSIIDYSIKSTDDFGNTVIVQRAYSKRADYDVTVETLSVASVQKVLADIRTTPTVFIGDEDRTETVVYGFYKQFNIVLSTPSISSCSIEVEGLV